MCSQVHIADGIPRCIKDLRTASCSLSFAPGIYRFLSAPHSAKRNSENIPRAAIVVSSACTLPVPCPGEAILSTKRSPEGLNDSRFVQRTCSSIRGYKTRIKSVEREKFEFLNGGIKIRYNIFLNKFIDRGKSTTLLQQNVLSRKSR